MTFSKALLTDHGSPMNQERISLFSLGRTWMQKNLRRVLKLVYYDPSKVLYCQFFLVDDYIHLPLL